MSFAEKIVSTFEKIVPDPAIQRVKIRLTIRRGICGAIPFNTSFDRNELASHLLLQHMHNTEEILITPLNMHF